MAAASETPRPNGNGSIRQAADGVGHIAAPVQRLATLAPPAGDAIAHADRLERLTQEVAAARRRGEELEAKLAKRTSRMQQLIGARDQLASLLAARDVELLRLTRELGALTERAAPGFLAAARAMLERVRPARRAPEPSASPRAPRAMERSSEQRLLPWLTDGPAKPVLAVVVLGLPEAEIKSVLDLVERHCAERDLAPLLLTDCDAFELFRGRRVLFEFLPAPAQQERFAAELDWRLFTLRRLALIRRKWQPVRVIAFGRTAAEVVQRWLDSPFEATPIPAPLRPSEGAELDWGEARQPSALRP
jgi:hypothetical protein